MMLMLLWSASITALNAQDCSSPAQLCADFPSGNTTMPAGNALTFDCLDADHTFFYEFTTNNNTLDPGGATVDVGGIDCAGEPVTGLIVEILDSTADPCDPANWSVVVSCTDSDTDFSMSTGVLNPDTDYFVILGTDANVAGGGCTMEVFVSGTAVDIDACCDESITLGESHTVTATGGDVPPGYSWSPVSFLDDFSSATVTSTPEETITYIVTGVVDGCIVTDEVTILVLPPITPTNAITPNGDGHNDEWVITGISSFQNASVTIFDRWGQEVFQSIGYAQPWDGTRDGKFLPTATYYYVIELNSFDVNIAPITGFVTVVH